MAQNNKNNKIAKEKIEQACASLTLVGENKIGFSLAVSEFVVDWGGNQVEDHGFVNAAGLGVVNVVFTADKELIDKIEMAAKQEFSGYDIQKVVTACVAPKAKTAPATTRLYDMDVVAPIDRPGIARNLLEHLAGLKVNIRQVHGRRIPIVAQGAESIDPLGAGDASYAGSFEIEISEHSDIKALRRLIYKMEDEHQWFFDLRPKTGFVGQRINGVFMHQSTPEVESEDVHPPEWTADDHWADLTSPLTPPEAVSTRLGFGNGTGHNDGEDDQSLWN